MKIVEIVAPVFEIRNLKVRGGVYIFCSDVCEYGKDCKPREGYKKIVHRENENKKRIVYALEKKIDKQIVKAEINDIFDDSEGSGIKCPSGKRYFRFRGNFVETDKHDFGNFFEKYRKIYMRQCDLI